MNLILDDLDCTNFLRSPTWYCLAGLEALPMSNSVSNRITKQDPDHRSPTRRIRE